MIETDSDTILATITPSAPRRLFGIAVLAGLGGLLIYLGLTRPPAALGWQVFLLGLGAATLTLAEMLRRATDGALELTRDALRDSAGRIIAPVDLIARVDRSMFAVKPSNGFVISLSAPMKQGNHWAPGLWWRVGRRVGVGGITSAAEARAMAQVLSMLTAERSAHGD